jgi:hypothetical protein
MSKQKLLNLDEIVPDAKTIKLDGFDHVARELTVEEFIMRSKDAQRAQADAEALGEDAPLAAKTEKIIDLIHDAFPTITVARLGKLSLPQLNAVLEFTITPPAEIARQTEEAAASGNAG